MPGFRLIGLRFFRVMANLIFGVFLRRARISAKRASPPNRASLAHVISPVDLLRTNSSKLTFELNLIVRQFSSGSSFLRSSFPGLRSSVFVFDTTVAKVPWENITSVSLRRNLWKKVLSKAFRIAETKLQ